MNSSLRLSTAPAAAPGVKGRFPNSCKKKIARIGVLGETIFELFSESLSYVYHRLKLSLPTLFVDRKRKNSIESAKQRLLHPRSSAAMSARAFFELVVASITLIVCCASLPAQTTSSAPPVSPTAMYFGDHDTGTATAQTLAATNIGDGYVNLSVRISGSSAGDTPGDFSWNSTCLNKVPPKGSCEITALFNPVTIGKDKGEGEVRSATLTVTNDKDEHWYVSLEGRAFQNLHISPTVLEFENQIGNTASAARTVRLINYTDSAVNSITVTATGDFTENHAGCATPIAPGGSCGILVAFSPKQAGDTSGSLTVTSNLSNLGSLPRVISLYGLGLSRCKVPKFSLRDSGSQLVLIISGLYFLGLVLVRWHMIAKPVRALLVAEIEAVRSRAVAETADLPDSPGLNERLARIHFLLDEAVYPFKYKRFPINPAEQGRRKPVLQNSPAWYPWSTRVFNALFWTRGQELASWNLAHEAELQLVALLPVERVRARLETAEQQLRKINTPLALALADRARESLASGEALILERARQLLQQLKSLVKPLSVPDVARQVWLAGLQQRLLNSLQQFGDWLQQNTGPAATLEDCRSRIQRFLKTAAAYQGLATDLAQLPGLPNVPPQSRNLLQGITPFLTQLVTAIQTIQVQISDPTLKLETCNNTLSSLAEFRSDAEKLVDELKNAAAPDQAKAYQTLLDLCKSQSTLVNMMTQATTPSPGVALLRDVLAALQQQNELIQKITQADAIDGAADLGDCRDFVLQLAAAPPLSPDLMSRIDSALLGEVPAPLGRWRALLAEALSLIYEDTDTGFYKLASWHNKMMWLVGCALLFMFALAVTLGNAVLLLVGAVGGLLSRLTRTTTAADVANDYGATWGSLFLSPLTGALSAWGGILLIILGVKLNILGTALNLDWCNPYEPVALAIALLFGFLERLFDSVTGQIQDKLLKSTPSSPAPATTPPAPVSPAPKIASLSPSSATIGKEIQLTVRGANFQPGATATVTKDTGEAVPAKLDFNDATAVIVTCTPSGGKAFTATLTIANPDKQVATTKFDVAATG